MAEVKLALLMSENFTIWDYTRPRNQIDVAIQAEAAGFSFLSFADHVLLGEGSDANGLPRNPRAYAMPGNQPVDFPHPNPMILAAGCAAATTSIRILLAAILAPLRHPLILAKELGTLDQLAEGRLAVVPQVGWHKAEYDALGIPFERRGDILDEQLEIMTDAWTNSPTSYHGEFFNFDDVYIEPKAYRPGGPALWFGGSSMHKRMLRRLANYGSGLVNVSSPEPEVIDIAVKTMLEAGRDPSALEFVTGIVGRLPDATGLADFDEALTRFRPNVEAGYTTFTIKPCQFIDDPNHLPEFLEQAVAKTTAIAAEVEPRSHRGRP